MKIAMGCDHAGFQLKNEIMKHLQDRGIEVLDLGCYSEDRVDYPVYGKKVGEAVAMGQADKGIVCCGTGIGISIAANKVKGIRCALVYSEFTAQMCKEHNDANIISFGGRTIEGNDGIHLTDIWLDTQYAGAHHTARVAMLDEM